jgi:hypothetical protein
MGGLGSGRPATKLTTGGCRAIDLAMLRATGRRSGTWSWSLAGEPMGSISWSLNDSALNISYWRTDDDGRCQEHIDRLSFSTTEGGFGGVRKWLVCPCGRRCRIVYIQSHGARCRKCYRLGYQSQRESAGTRTMTMAGKLIQRVAGNGPWNYEEFPPKPKRMHWSRYWALEARHHDLVMRGDARLRSFLLQRFGNGL